MMKIVTLELTAEQKKQLKDLQNNGSGYLRERSLAILHCAEGRKISWYIVRPGLVGNDEIVCTEFVKCVNKLRVSKEESNRCPRDGAFPSRGLHNYSSMQY